MAEKAAPAVRMDWSFEEAFAATFDRKEPFPKDFNWKDHPTLPLHQWTALNHIDRCRLLFEQSGMYMFALHSLYVCFFHEMAVPAWVSKAFVAAFDAVDPSTAASWDEVFGPPFPKGTHVKRLRHLEMHSRAVFDRVAELHAAGEPMDERLFKKVGKEFKIGKTSVSKYYYFWVRSLAFFELNPNRIRDENCDFRENSKIPGNT